MLSDITTFETSLELCQNADFDILFEATPMDLKNALPGYPCAKIAFEKGCHGKKIKHTVFIVNFFKIVFLFFFNFCDLLFFSNFCK